MRPVPAPASPRWSTRCWRRSRPSSCRSRPPRGRRVRARARPRILLHLATRISWRARSGRVPGVGRSAWQLLRHLAHLRPTADEAPAPTSCWKSTGRARARCKKQFPQAAGIFILPPSIAALEERLQQARPGRTACDHRRLLAAGGEIAHAPEFEYVIINQEFPVALSELTRSSERPVAGSRNKRPATQRCLPNWASTPCPPNKYRH
jgi:hypothetical protein